MTDELTREEREALDKLPRERLPAGLEARVVGAMQERGFLARRQRTIALSNTRVAGVLAAGVALMIGAYSLGLHRGGGDRLLPPVETSKPDDIGREDRPSPVMERSDTGTLTPDETLEAGRTTPEEIRRQAPQAPPVEVREEESQVAGRTAEPKKESDAAGKGLATIEGDGAESPMPAPPAPEAVVNESAARTRAARDSAVPEFSKTPLAFLLNGTPVVVEAPDSVRITQDKQGRMLIIYTSDGIIRIRLADDD